MSTRVSTQSKTLAAAGNYTAGDIMSESASNGVGTAWTFNDVGPKLGVVTILSSTITSSEDSVTFRGRLHLFKSNPSSSELDDNAAKAFAEADRTNFVGFVDFDALGDQGVPSWAVANNLPITVQVGTDGKLYGVLEDLSGETNESANMVVTISLFVAHDN